ncbi:2-amino-4-hydroxy-6-hydroxymethyldihydropteridine diphosphokinase [Candidatus Doolittlea endobia]|nr:2-amino-4-hydroxy-6-hydroxymethyldihydropteridine diphosphokinase [Candidatus Doolittlea endobia]
MYFNLDILLFGERIIITLCLRVPHYDMYNRKFVLYPLAGLARINYFSK